MVERFNFKDNDGDDGDGTPDDVVIIHSYLPMAGATTDVNVCRYCGDIIYKRVTSGWRHYPGSLQNCSLDLPMYYFNPSPMVTETRSETRDGGGDEET